jgi:hypothetical protein
MGTIGTDTLQNDELFKNLKLRSASKKMASNKQHILKTQKH